MLLVIRRNSLTCDCFFCGKFFYQQSPTANGTLQLSLKSFPQGVFSLPAAHTDTLLRMEYRRADSTQAPRKAFITSESPLPATLPATLPVHLIISDLRVIADPPSEVVISEKCFNTCVFRRADTPSFFCRHLYDGPGGKIGLSKMEFFIRNCFTPPIRVKAVGFWNWGVG